MRNERIHPDTAPSAGYLERVNLAIDHIVTSLHRPLGLDELAAVACFSPFHFHRVFRAVVGETPGQFTKRLRLERALAIMSHGRTMTLTEIALECGFASSSDFSRSFKQRYECSPSTFDIKTWRESKRGDLASLVEQHCGVQRVERLPVGANPDGFTAELRDTSPRTVAYIRVLDPYRTTGVVEACQRLVAWAESGGLADNQWYGYQWDDPEIVSLKDCRYDVAVEAPGVSPDGEIGRFEFPAMRVAQIEMAGGIDLELRALDWLYGAWLPNSGYVPDDQPCFEAWIGRPFAHGHEHFELRIQLPIKKA